MAAATVTTKVYEKNVPAIPGMEVVNLTISDGETYTAKTLSAVDSVCITYGADPATGNPIGATISGKTVTFQCTGASDVLFYVVLFGKP